jgi:hypothetical protein
MFHNPQRGGAWGSVDKWPESSDGEWLAPGLMGMWTTQTGCISGLLPPQPLHELQRLQALREGRVTTLL